MTRSELLGHLRRMGSCTEAVKWVKTTKSRPADLWGTCPRGDWLLWLAARAGVSRHQIVLSAFACARNALPLVPADEDRLRIAIETGERWARGEVSLNEVRAAAAYATYAAAAAAADAAYGADADAAYGADAAADAAAAAYDAADDADDASALAWAAEIVRGQIPWAAVEAALVGDE